MKILDAYSLAGNPLKHNEDKIGITKSMVWLMDGATPMQKTIDNEYNSDAAWFVNEFNTLLQKNYILGLNFSIKKSLEEISKIYNENCKNNDELMQYKMPSAQFVAIESHKNSNIINLAFVGDTRILVKYKNGDVEVFGETILDEIDKKALSITKDKEKEVGSTGIENRLKLGTDTIIDFRKMYMNKPEGFFTLTPSLDAYELDGIGFTTLKMNTVDKIILATDGLLSIVENYKKMNYSEMFEHIERTCIAHLTQNIRVIEENDPDGEEFLRFKKSDDTSGVLIGF